jgi:FkbM family methyltransferase
LRTVKQLLKYLFPISFLKFIKGILNKEFRVSQKEDARIKRLDRYVETEIIFRGKEIRIADNASFLFMRKEVFDSEVYKFKSSNDSPFIIDCGANIGLSIIYFKSLFPQSRIIAFEPDDKIFSILKSNVESFDLLNVELIKKACWDKETTLKFFSEGADGGRTASSSDQEQIIYVETIRLRNYLTQRIDFLKIDIEGAESTVIPDIADLLHLVENIFVEFHSFINQEQLLPEILTTLKHAGFRLHISAPGLTSKNPFVHLSTYASMDNQLNIYGFRV